MSEHEVEHGAGASPVEASTPDNSVDEMPAAPDGSIADDGPVGGAVSGGGPVAGAVADDSAGGGAVADDSPVSGALAELDTLADRDLAEHPEVFERIHGELHAALTAIDDA